MPHKFLFYLERIGQDAELLRLEGEEHHHLSKVIRMKCGETAYVTDGAGAIVECRVIEIRRDAAELQVVRNIEMPAQKRLPVLALGCIKKDRFEKAVAYGTELGMERCIPLITGHPAAKNYTEQFIARLRSIAVSAMKQSFRSLLPAIEPPLAFDDLLERMISFDRILVGCQEAPGFARGSADDSLMIVIGPEAGFTTEEMEKLESAGASFVSASSHRLRSETAALAMLVHLNSPPGDRQSD
jgi:16S rRNA (uracil1498-N3)-methyltransferase